MRSDQSRSFLGVCLGVRVGRIRPGEEEDTRPAFSLSTSEVFTTRDAPNFYLTFRRIPRLDFRVYKVRDPFAFFEGLDDPHQFGTSEAQRQAGTHLARALCRLEARAAPGPPPVRPHAGEPRLSRRAPRGRRQGEVSQRVVLNANTFAQVPLLNADQVVTSWRELLPNNRDAEVRRVPVDLKQPGIYVVEAVNDLLRAYTIVIVLRHRPGDEDLAGPDAVLRRESIHRRAGAELRHPRGARKEDDRDRSDECRRPVRGDAARSEDGEPHRRREVRRSARRDRSGIVDAGAAGEGAGGYVYTDKPIYRPGHTVHVKAVLRWRQADALVRFDRPDAEVAVSDINDKVVFRKQVKIDSFGSIEASFPVPATAALGNYTIRIQSGDAIGSGAFEVQEYRKPEFEVIVTPQSRFVVQGHEAIVTVQARYYFGQPVANGRLHWVVNQQPYYSPLRWDDESKATAIISTATISPRPARCGSMPTARRSCAFRSTSTRTCATSPRASRRRSPTPRIAKSRAARSCTRPTDRSCSSAETERDGAQGRQPRAGVRFARWITSAPRNRMCR